MFFGVRFFLQVFPDSVQKPLHLPAVLFVDDLRQAGQRGDDVVDLCGRLGVEEDFRQQVVVFGE